MPWLLLVANDDGIDGGIWPAIGIVGETMYFIYSIAPRIPPGRVEGRQTGSAVVRGAT